MKKIIILSLLIMPLLVYAVNYTDYLYGGYRVEGGINGKLPLFYNPAMNPSVWWNDNKLMVFGMFDIAMPVEIRTENVFDSYSNAIGERTVYYGQYIYTYPTIGWATYKVNDYLRVQGGYSVFMSNEYTYEKIEYDGYYVPIYKNEIRNMGRIENWGVQLITGYKDIVSFGLGTYYMFGKPYYSETRTYIPTGEDEYMNEIFVTKIYAYMFNMGMWIKLHNRAKLFIAGDLPFSIKRTYDEYIDTTGTRELVGTGLTDYVDVPPVLRGGLEFYMPNQLPVVFDISVDYYFNHYADSTMNDVINYGVMVSHKMSKDTKMYYGFKWNALPLNNTVSRVELLNGMELTLNKSRMIIGWGYRYSSYWGDEINSGDTYHHEERDFFITSGVTINIAK